MNLYIYNVNMPELEFDWDSRKNGRNRAKHGVSFEEAQTVFFDANAVEFYDPDHSIVEDRFLLLGRSFRLRMLLVCYCCPKGEHIIRIISARKATKKEQNSYQGKERV